VSELWALSASELLAGYRAREFSPVDAVGAVASRIDALNPSLGAFTTLCLDRALEEARSASGPLAGIPFAVKDLIDSADVRTTYGSRMFRDHVPHRDAPAVAALRAAGAILVGKTQTHEFAWGITSINESMGSSHNPWDVSRVPGGSSGGSAVALAARLVPLAVGTDTGGSIRIPAGFCGVMGLKPTHGRLSAQGVWPLAPSLDSVGPLARTPDDLALMLAAMEGRVLRDAGGRGLAGVTVVTCSELLSKPLPPDRARVHDDAIRVIEGLGARVVERPFPVADLIDDTFRVIQACEAAKVHEDAGLFPARTEEYGGDVRHRLSYSAELDPREYLDAAADREVLRAAFGRLLHDGALLVSPISAVPPAHADDLVALHGFRSGVMPNTTPQNLAGLPAVALRAGFDDEGLPVGIQFTAAPWRDEDALGAARAFYEATAEVQGRWPALTGR
jgi:aspartyl-tRNA(Asn)/glutamyl-tRNA(Gln) amidotransferase subunit A